MFRVIITEIHRMSKKFKDIQTNSKTFCGGVGHASLTASVLRAFHLEPFKRSAHQDREWVASAHISVQGDTKCELYRL